MLAARVRSHAETRFRRDIIASSKGVKHMASAIPVLTEDEFRERTVNKYREHFNHVYRLLEFAQEAISKYKYSGNWPTPYHRCLTLIFPRAYKSFDAIRRLCEVAYCEDAGVILRSLLNLLVVTRWISIEPERDRRARKYLAWYWIAMQSDVQKFGLRVAPKGISYIQTHYDRAKKQFEYRDDKGNTQMPKQWYQPEAQTLRDLFGEVGLEKHYEEAYRPLSGIEHSDATTYLPMLMSIEQNKEDEMRLEILNDVNVPDYLRNAFQYFGEIFKLCNEGDRLGDGTRLQQILSDGVEFYKTEMQSRGISPT